MAQREDRWRECCCECVFECKVMLDFTKFTMSNNIRCPEVFKLAK